MVGVWTSNNPIPFFSLHGSGLSWSKDSTSSKSGEWGFIFRQNRPKWKISWSVWPRRDYHTVLQVLHWIRMMFLHRREQEQQSSQGESNHQRPATIQPMRLRRPKDHPFTGIITRSMKWRTLYMDRSSFAIEDTCLGCSVSCTWSSWRSPVLWLFV